jgi:hypothetical protein
MVQVLSRVGRTVSMMDRDKILKPNEDPHRQTHMVSASDYYKKRGDIQLGLKKRDFPSAPDSTPSESDDDAKVMSKEAPAAVAPSLSSAKH